MSARSNGNQPPPGDLVGTPGQWALVLDFDGTLVELAASPDAIRVPAGLPRLLKGLFAHFGGAVAILTGRALGDLDEYLPGLSLPAAGQHGSERRLHPGQRAFVADVPALERVRREIAGFQVAHPALQVEDKGASIALHYRAAPAMREAVLTLADRLTEAAGGALEQIEGKCVCELRPTGSNKGGALAAFLAEAPFAERRPLAIGDDLTDEAAFAVALEAKGDAIKVGTGETRASWRLGDPREVRAWLAQILDARRLG
ncbi:MAG: trehalose-phosphatase [Gammaproteobacteria bacterium]